MWFKKNKKREYSFEEKLFADEIGIKVEELGNLNNVDNKIARRFEKGHVFEDSIKNIIYKIRYLVPSEEIIEQELREETITVSDTISKEKILDYVNYFYFGNGNYCDRCKEEIRIKEFDEYYHIYIYYTKMYDKAKYIDGVVKIEELDFKKVQIEHLEDDKICITAKLKATVTNKFNMEYIKQFDSFQKTILSIQDFFNLKFKIKNLYLVCEKDREIVTKDGFLATEQNKINFELESQQFAIDNVIEKQIEEFASLNEDLVVKLSYHYSEKNDYYYFLLNIKTKTLDYL